MGKVRQLRPRCVLAVAGSDSGGGAGIQADARAIRASGCHALTAITAVTAQNTRGVEAWEPVSPALIARQMTAVLEDFSVGAVKTGLLPGAAAVRAVVRALAVHSRLPLVVDPVLESTSGTRFLDRAGVRELKRRLLPRAALVTPNWPEAAEISGLPVRTLLDAERVALKILETGCGAVLVKGGHGEGGSCVDILVTKDGSVRRFSGRRIGSRNTHGTGCVLASAIAAGLARGRPLLTAVADARCLLRGGLLRDRSLNWGAGSGAALR